MNRLKWLLKHIALWWRTLRRRDEVRGAPEYEPHGSAKLRRRRNYSISHSLAANCMGFPFQQPNGRLPRGYFWKQDEGVVDSIDWLYRRDQRAWRIYREPPQQVNR